MQFDLLSSLVVFAVMTLFVPGPNNLLLMASGASFGLRASTPHIFGAVLGFTALMAASVTGLSVLIETVPIIGDALKIGGALWLTWFGLTFLQSAHRPQERTAGPPQQGRSRPFQFHEAIAFQWINPGALVLAVSTTGAFAEVADTPLMRTLTICAVFAAVGLLATLVWTSIGLQLSRFFSSARTAPYAKAGMGMLIIGTAAMIVLK